MNVDITQLPLPLMQQVFDELGDIVFCVKDTQSCYRAVNIAFVERVGATSKEALHGKQAKDLFPSTLANNFDQQDQVVFTTARPIQDQLERISNTDGSMSWFLASKFPLRDRHDKLIGLVGISQDLKWPRESDVELANLKRMVEYVHDNLDQPLRADALAEQMNMSTIQLDRRMKRVFRLSTKKFIMKCRLEKASRQLESSDLPISSIALACGFADQSSFTRQFRQTTSTTPASFRKMARGQ